MNKEVIHNIGDQSMSGPNPNYCRGRNHMPFFFSVRLFSSQDADLLLELVSVY